MFESEANLAVGAVRVIPRDVLQQFKMWGKGTVSRSLLLWGEHCTECAAPACYATCEYYSPRPDLGCRRFRNGMVRIRIQGAQFPYLLSVTFKKWGKLLAYGTAAQRSLREAWWQELRDVAGAEVLQRFPMRFGSRIWWMRQRNGRKKGAAVRRSSGGGLPTSLVLQCYNPGDQTCDFLLAVSRVEEGHPRFHERIQIRPGYNCIAIAADRIIEVVNIMEPINVGLFPDENVIGRELYFGLIDFVREPAVEKKPSNRTKCVVWDLDNTLWKGTLVEEGANGLRLNEEAVRIIRHLDSHGVVNSIASKNDRDPVQSLLRDLGLIDLFVFPQISWGTKSAAIGRIAASLNINRDTLIFVDDTEFERQEVKLRFPEVRTLHPLHMELLMQLPECQEPVTEEGRGRRSFYLEQAKRQEAEHEFEGDYEGFLRQCCLKVTLRRLSEKNLDRVHELSQRTNQLNFSGIRYERSALKSLLDDGEYETWVLDCIDRYGDYGTIGFAVVRKMVPLLSDMMFSCRVQGRRVEHAFLMYLIKRCRDAGLPDLQAIYRRSGRNGPAGRVFEDLGFELLSESDGVSTLVFRNSVARHAGIVEIIEDFQ